MSFHEKQKKIELLLNETWYKLFVNDLNSVEPFTVAYNEVIKLFILKFRVSLKNLLDSINYAKIPKHLIPIINTSIDDIARIVFKLIIPILFTGEEVNKTTFIIKIGESLFNNWVKLEYKKYLEKFKDIENKVLNVTERVSAGIMDFATFKKSFDYTDKDFLSMGDSIFNLIIDNDNAIFQIELNKSDPNNTKVFIKPTTKYNLLFENVTEVLGFKLPMLCPPVPWSKEKYGGYLYNQENYKNPLIIPSKKSTYESVINNDIIYNTVNYMSNIPFKINKDVLSFILINSEALGIKNELHPKTSLIYKAPFKLKKEITSFNSLFYLHKNILGLANLFSSLDEFYFVLQLDWRGRLYCDTSYLNFQGNELAKSLIKFKCGGIIDEKGLYFLKIYGANAYGLDKKSFSNRIQWVDNNQDNIINMNIDFILKASEPFIFIAFCFKYREYLKDPNNFLSTLPIMLDASCNGLQHLAAMVGESSIAKNVNLFESSVNDKPMDFYQFSLELINKNYMNLVEIIYYMYVYLN